MSQVRTLLKDINSEDMGFTLSHEHLLCSPPHWIWKKEEDLILDDPEKTLADMKDYERLGAVPSSTLRQWIMGETWLP